MRIGLTALALFVAALVAGTALQRPAGAQGQPAQPAAAAAAAAATPGQPPQPGSDAVRVGDLLVLTIPELIGPSGDFVKPVRVDAAGRISVPYGKEPLTVEKLTLAEVEKAVNQALAKSGAMERPGAWVDRMERGGDGASVQPGPIAPGDVLRFAIVDLHGPGVEWVRHLHVSEAGNIGLPYLGQTKVAGMTESEAEAALLKAYQDKQVVQYVPVSVLRIKLPAGPEPIPQSDKPRLTK